MHGSMGQCCGRKEFRADCAVGGTIVTRRGSITGRDRQCFLIGGLFGRSLTLNTTAAIYGVVAATARTVSYSETY